MAGVLVAQGQRLSLHRFDVSDAAGFKRMNDDPLALQYTGDKPFDDLNHAQQFLNDYDHYQHHGFGRWSIYLSDGRYAGFCGLRYNTKRHHVDLGFRVPVPLWRQGIATEAAQLALQLGFEHHQLAEIVANAMPANLASFKLLQRLGMTQQGQWSDQFGQWQRFSLSAQQWRRIGNKI